MKKLNYLLSISLLSGVFLLSSCEKDNGPDPMADNDTPSIVDFAKANDNFSILVDALSRAGLTGTLSGAGDYTVFAPVNAAFTELFTNLGVSSVEDIPVDDLKPILLYHVLGESKSSGMIMEGYYSSLSPAQGSTVSMYISTTGGVSINGAANVTAADVEVSNGIIHAIDAVLIPMNVVDIAINNSSFSKLVAAVVKADLVETLSGEGPFTVFAPTDAAFDQLFQDLGVAGINDIPAADLVPILQYHVVSGNVLSTALSDGNVPTLNGDISFDLSDGVRINGSTNVIATDVQGSNGVVHVIDKVLLPQ